MRFLMISILWVLGLGTALADGVNPLEARMHSEDAHRFVAVFEAADGAPSAEALQAGYLDGAGRGVEIFTPNRIRSAEHLARQVAGDPEAYRRAIDVCLPIADAATDDLRAIYLGLRGVFPDRALPEIHVVFGAGNSGGTAGPGAQVLGLEVICAIADTPAAIRQTLRGFFAHETVHVLQSQLTEEIAYQDLLLASALREGMADYISHLVTGQPPTPARDEWASAREAELWKQFQVDRKTINAAIAAGETYETQSESTKAAYQRWFSNYNSAPDGWPHEVGYWIGRRIATAYVAQADDKSAAIEDLMDLKEPLRILEESGYDGQLGRRQ